MPTVVYSPEERKAMARAAEGARMMVEGRERRDQAIRDMVELGLPVAVIAEAAGVTRQTVHRVTTSA